METTKGLVLKVPKFNSLSEIEVPLEATRVAESRLLEAKTVNISTYSDLEYTFNESYRELKRALAAVSYRLAKAEEEMENAKAAAILDKYPEFIKDKPKSFDNADTRKSFIQRDAEYRQAADYRDQIKVFEALLDSRIKVMERTCSYMRKQMDLLIRSGTAGNSNTYRK